MRYSFYIAVIICIVMALLHIAKFVFKLINKKIISISDYFTINKLNSHFNTRPKQILNYETFYKLMNQSSHTKEKTITWHITGKTTVVTLSNKDAVSSIQFYKKAVLDNKNPILPFFNRPVLSRN